MLSDGTYVATAEPVKLPDNVYVAQPTQYSQYSQAVQAQPVGQQPTWNGQYYAQPYPAQQPVAPVYVAAPQQQQTFTRYQYDVELERQRRMNAELHARNVDAQIRYEQRRRQQEQEEACCCLALGAVCCAAFLAAN